MEVALPISILPRRLIQLAAPRMISINGLGMSIMRDWPRSCVRETDCQQWKLGGPLMVTGDCLQHCGWSQVEPIILPWTVQGAHLLRWAWASPTLTSSTSTAFICCCCCSMRLTVNHLWLLFCALLCHLLIQKLLTNYSVKDMNHRTSSMAPARTETSLGPTYSMTRAIWATPRQKGFICRCDCLRCTIAHSQWTPLVTWTNLSNNGHIDELVGESATSV